MSPLTFFKCLSEDTRLKSMLLIAVIGERVDALLHVAELDKSQWADALTKLGAR